MHVAAMKPAALSIEELDKSYIAKEEEIIREQATKNDKPHAVIEKMVQGRLNKMYEEVVLLEQPFVMDPKIKIRELIENTTRELGATIKLEGFVRFELGEGVK